MPGVPSGRGCDACRKQKKKCDQSKPKCSRCTRLKIPCIGSGEQRYKFKNTTAPPLKTANSQTQGSQELISLRNSSTIIRVPESKTFTLAQSMIKLLEVGDVRYDLTCYGTFLDEIPKRLGRNPALDASVQAFSTCSTCVYTKSPSVAGLKSYIHALKTLRGALSNPAIAESPDTLCAIYLVMVCQGWMGNPYDQYTSHGEGIAHILKKATTGNWTGTFETEMMLTLCIPVLVESVCNPKIQIGTWFYQLLDAYAPPKKLGCEEPKDIKESRDQAIIPSLKFRTLANVTEYINDPEPHHDDILKVYARMKIDSQKLRQIVEGIAGNGEDPLFPRPGPGVSLHREVRDFSTAYGIVLTLMMALNGILHALDPEDISLNDDAVVIGTSILQLAKELSPYRPLGASHIPLCLTVAWAAIDDNNKRAEVEAMIADYQTDFTTMSWMDMAYWWRNRFDVHRRNRIISRAIDVQFEGMKLIEATPLEQPPAPKQVGDACCVM